MQIRRYKVGEEDTLRNICRDTTLQVNVMEYGTELVEKWTARLSNISKWKERVRRKNPFVAESDGILVGFAELSENGRIGAFYSHYKWQRKGVGKALYEAIEAEALRLKIDTLQVDSSVSASRFFEANGFRIVGEIETVTDGIPSKSLCMRKSLTRKQGAAADA